MPNLNVGLSLALGGISSAHALACLASACTGSEPATNLVRNCLTQNNTKCYNGYLVSTCDECESGYTRTAYTQTVSGCSNSITFYDCVSSSSGGDEEDDDCDGTCTDCTSDTLWSTPATGYQVKVTRTCNTSTCTCTENASTRCATGYYASAAVSCLMGLTGTYTCRGCSRCPQHSDSGQYGYIAAGTASITSCYIGTGVSWSFSDTTGSGTTKFSSTCYYSE